MNIYMLNISLPACTKVELWDLNHNYNNKREPLINCLCYMVDVKHLIYDNEALIGTESSALILTT